MSEVTQIINELNSGDERNVEALLPLIYDELRRLASAKLAHEPPGATLQATALVHEAYLRLTRGVPENSWNGRNHFFGAAAEAMRRILVEAARRRKADKRGGDQQRVPLHDQIESPARSVDLLALNEALDALAVEDARKAELVKLRYFAGCTTAEAAQLLGISVSTAHADWAYAKSWLKLAVESS